MFVHERLNTHLYAHCVYWTRRKGQTAHAYLHYIHTVMWPMVGGLETGSSAIGRLRENMKRGEQNMR